MGFLRYFLAIIVVISHSPAISIHAPLAGNGGIAVAVFFVISGFYMSLIVERYQLKNLNFTNLKNFYLSRFFRIYPIYYICLLITLLLYFFHVISLLHPPIDILSSFDKVEDKVLYLFVNLFIFGQSLIRFFIYDANASAFVLHYINNINILPSKLGSGYEILGQSWSLSIELTFYVLVPFILTKTKKLIFALCVSSFVLRIIMMHIDSKSDFASDFFFPVTIGLFLMGSLAHQIIYKFIKIRSSLFEIKILAFIIILSAFLFSIFCNLEHVADNLTTRFWVNWWLFISLITLAIPFLFLYTEKSKWDHFLGELSYPIYMSHLFCLAIVSKYVINQYTAYYTILLSTVISIFLILFIVKPLDKYRHARFLSLRKKAFETTLPVKWLEPGVQSG